MSKLMTPALLDELKQYVVANLKYEDDVDDGSSDDVLSVREFSPAATAAILPSVSELKTMLARREQSFSDELNDLIVRSGKSNVEIYSAAQMDRRLFSKICNRRDYRPTKLTALALAIALELTLEQTRDFISRAGYALTRSSVTDLVVEFFIERKIYDVLEINEALYELDQPLLGNVIAEDKKTPRKESDDV